MNDHAYKLVTPADSSHSNLPRLMRADCGHYIPDGTDPVGQYQEPMSGRWLPVYLCGECSPNKQQPVVEIKRGPGRPRKQQP